MSDNEMWEAMQDEELPEKYDEEPYRVVERLDSDASLEDKRMAWERLMDRARVAGPNKEKAKEFIDSDSDTETEESPRTIVGTMSSTSARPAYTSGGIVGGGSHSHGTWVSPSSSPPYSPIPSGVGTGVVPGGGMSWGVPGSKPAPAPVEKPAKAKDMIPMPPRFTEKVLLAFLEEEEGMDDKLVWAAHLLAQHFEMRLEDGEIRLVMEFSLRDHYDNNPSTED